jgi:hypothetical protein
MSKPLKFPDPKARSPNAPAVLCPADRVIGLYNSKHPKKTAMRLSPSVKTWFSEEAHAAGWIGVQFLPDAQTAHGAGCIMWVSQQHDISLSLEATMLVIADSNEHKE